MSAMTTIRTRATYRGFSDFVSTATALFVAWREMSGDDASEQFRDSVEDATSATPEYLLFPIAVRTVMMTPDDLVEPGQPRCASKGRLVGSISNGVALVPVQRDLRCGRRPDHDGAHLLLISPAAGRELSWFYEWADPSPV